MKVNVCTTEYGDDMKRVLLDIIHILMNCPNGFVNQMQLCLA